jgi:hypothetical protein
MTTSAQPLSADEYYSYGHWKDELVSDYRKYKSFVFYENIAKPADLPPGYIVQLGVCHGHTLQEMKQHWGSDRVLGIDIHNPSDDPNVWRIDIKRLQFKLPCAYIENDIGDSFSEYGKNDRWAAAQWGISCLIPGGIMITSADHMIGYPVREYAQAQGCDVIDMSQRDHEPWAQYLNTTAWKTQGWYLIIKR